MEVISNKNYYHRDLIESVGTISSFEELKKLPLTTKKMVKKYYKNFLLSKNKLILNKKTTGGSTGEPVTIFKTNFSFARELAATWRGYSWAGIDIGHCQGRFWGVPLNMKGRVRANVIDFITNRKRISAFAFKLDDFPRYTEILRKYNPIYFYGYVSMIKEYAEYFKKRKERPPFNLKCIITTSEVLSNKTREIIENVFQTKVFNEYGCGELGTIAHECEAGSLHLSAENLITEVIDPNKDGIGELVITELNNKAFPLIRYKVGDFGKIINSGCTCGKTLPILQNIYGRAYDLIKNKNGEIYHPEFFMYILEAAKDANLGIGAYQIVQEDYDKFLIKIVPENNYSKKTEEFIISKIRVGFDVNTLVKFDLIDQIKRTPSGKMQIIIGLK